MHSALRGDLSPVDVLAFRRKLIHWYRTSARDLPWRGIREPYHTWVSEVMLQQTRVAAVLDHYERFLRMFPTVFALALAPEAEVLGLKLVRSSYYRRARMLHKAAQFLVAERAGIIPETSTGLRILARRRRVHLRRHCQHSLRCERSPSSTATSSACCSASPATPRTRRSPAATSSAIRPPHWSRTSASPTQPTPPATTTRP